MIGGVLVAMLSVLAGGLAWQQIFNHSKYVTDENLQMLRCILQPGPRGRILDRNGKVLVDNAPRYSVVLYVDELRAEFNTEFNHLRLQKLAQLHDDTTEAKHTPNSAKLYADARFNVALRYLEQANTLLGRNQALDRVAFDRAVEENPLLPFTLVDNLTPTEYARFNAQMPVNSHLQTKVDALRNYPKDGPSLFHTLGYVTSSNDILSDQNLNAGGIVDLWRQYLRKQPSEALPKHLTFALPEWTGGFGLEQSYNNQLRGETGGEIWVVDPSAAKCELLAHTTPQKGADLQISIDRDLQLAAEKAFLTSDPQKPQIGSAVALDVQTGEVLAMAVSPTFDLNQTVPHMSSDLLDALGARKGNWLNGATKGLYPAGSTYKLIDTIAGMRAGLLDGNTHLDCPASMTFNSHVFNESSHLPMGNIDLETAIQKSSDVFFYQVGVNILGWQRIVTEARRLGLGQITSLGLEQREGLVPDPAWKKANRNDAGDNHGNWSEDDTANLAIGQGYVQVTPLQMACLIASIARDETRTQPTLVHDPALNPATVQHGGEPLGLTPELRAVLLAGMEKVVGPEGTGKLVQIPGIRIAGKSGTAQWGPQTETTVAWFICFAPIEHPHIALAVAVEGVPHDAGNWGGQIAGPIAHNILEAYFKEYPENKK
jgi:penicillin-binding protein 2